MDDLEYEKRENKPAIDNPERLSWYMVGLCYICAFFLVGVIIYSFSGVLVDIIKLLLESAHMDDQFGIIDRFKVLAFVGIAYFLWKLVVSLGGHWRTSSKNEIGTAVTNFPNPFYDPSYSKGPLVLQNKYRTVLTQYKVNRKLLERNKEKVDELVQTLGGFESKIRVLLRHHDNTNRLIKSLNYLTKKDEGLVETQMIGHILAECMTVLEKDQSDKTITLFQVSGEKLTIKESVRINAESVFKRSFDKGEGFAGSVWESGIATIVNSIEDDDQRFTDGGLAATPIGSILGFPLKVEEDIYGVLCLQSEAADGFNEADLRAIEFYARMCTFILLYDKMRSKGGGNT